MWKAEVKQQPYFFYAQKSSVECYALWHITLVLTVLQSRFDDLGNLLLAPAISGPGECAGLWLRGAASPHVSPVPA